MTALLSQAANLLSRYDTETFLPVKYSKGKQQTPDGRLQAADASMRAQHGSCCFLYFVDRFKFYTKIYPRNQMKAGLLLDIGLNGY